MFHDLIAPFNFAILKSQSEIDRERQTILDHTNFYFRFNETRNQKIHDLFIAEFGKKWDIKYSNLQLSKAKKERQLHFGLQLIDTLLIHGIIEPVPGIENISTTPIFIIKGNEVEEKKLGDFFTISTADHFIAQQIHDNPGYDGSLILACIGNSIDHNLLYDAETTEKEKQQRISQLSLSYGLVQSGERIISKGEVVTEEKFKILQSLRTDYESTLGSSIWYTGIIIGQVILMAVVLATLFLYLYFFRSAILEDPRKLIMILLLILFIVVITTAVLKYDPDFIYLIPVCLIPIIVGVFTDSRLALFVHLVGIIITGLIVPNSYEFVFLQLLAGIITILSMVKLERRSQFFFTSLMIFLTYSVSYTGMTLIKEGNLNDLQNINYAMFAGSGILTLISYPVIFVFEKIFGLITNVTLMELSNTNNKLLRDLALKAPGTFQHSMQMANLAEAAIQDIGGNPLLVRTGAMYHDIGKMDDPLYFIENQTTGVNPHDELSNDESSEVIIEHIPRGVELARKYKLPEQIIDFIRTHHGTRRTEYFYVMAQKENPDEEIDPRIYTYPGPEPFSKETAVLMMADTVEAASRALKIPDEESIDKLVEGIINKQIESKQFDNADITLRDIKRIKSVFKKKLMNIYHLRIEYPT